MHHRIIPVLTAILLTSLVGVASGQNNIAKRIDLNWKQNAALGLEFSFEGAYTMESGDKLFPVYYQKIRVSDPNVKAVINVIETGSVQISDRDKLAEIGQDFKVKSYVTSERGVKYLNVTVLPFRSRGVTEKLHAFEIQLEPLLASERKVQPGLRKKSHYKTASVLADGEWLKIRTNREGIFEITRALLESGGWSPGNIDLNTIKVYGNGGGLLHEHIDEPRIDDLEEIRIKEVDKNGNNRLDSDDRLYFYGQGATIWKFEISSNRFIHENHHYDRYNYYFITYGGSTGKRVFQLHHGQGQPFDATIDRYEVMVLHELDEVNFIQTGRDWFGNSFRDNTIQTFSHTVNSIPVGVSASIRFRTTARSTITSYMSLRVNGATVIENFGIPLVSGDYEDPYAADPVTRLESFVPQSENISLQFQYTPTSPDADAWIDYYELAIPRNLNFDGSQGQYMVYSKEMQGLASGKYRFTGSGYELWDVTDHQNTGIQTFYTADGKNEFITFNTTENKARRYCAFNGSSAYTPEMMGKVANQNLHALAPVNYLMVTHSSLIGQASRLAQFHREEYGVSVEVVDVRQIYNEFSSGKADVVAIRDFIKMIYDRSMVQGVEFENVLMFGDGSYDYKDILANNTNLVPAFESRNSISPTRSYVSDDFYAILEDGEGRFDTFEEEEGLDVGIGRIPARTELQAKIYVDKVLRYHSADAFGSWRNNVTLLGDDEDSNIHINDSEKLDSYIMEQAEEINVNKIYLDAFEQVSYGSGDKYPSVNEAIDKSFEKGHLIFNYLGHGGGNGMAHERVVTRTMIREWDNRYALPLVITATCELSRYDDPSQDSPGELMMFNENGGSIGLITTTRLVYIIDNFNLNEAVIDSNILIKDINGSYPKLGQSYTRATNNSYRKVGQRNFTLLGDPGIRLAYPEHRVVTTKVNDSLITSGFADTLKAFRKMRFEGEIRDLNGSLVSDFNGVVSPTVFDKPIEYKTLANDPKSSARSFYMQNSAIYRGKVSVINGKFFFEFVVPKDIDYRYGNGKILYYAQSATSDANGANSDIVVGGTADDQIVDTLAPTVEIFMDDTEFIFGGLTGENALLLALVQDENGINTVGNGIGRNITATLDEGTDQEEVYILNDFYQAKLNSYQEGEIKYRLSDLTEGHHTVKIKVWDVFNNSSEAYTEFVVAQDADLALDHVLNYPNPFTTFTTFHFDHNKSGRMLDVTIKIMTPSGRVIKTLFASDIAAGGHFQGIDWDGKDEFGDNIGRGAYIYKVSVKSEDGTSTTEYQKLVILK